MKAKKLRKVVTMYAVKYMPSGAWVGMPGRESVQPVTFDQAELFLSEEIAADWATNTLRGRQFVVEPVEVIES